ncbi:SAM-dependent methyltransferase [Helicobacter pylori]|uniref:SAM-dependent methyltransferase n=1 Tax=Helicobacter pylori TaxID=210 RepID=UPI00165C95DD|nr:SAM-dependent methyltransferase [Helicobacter pylori]
MRLDYALFNQHLVSSREKAKALVLKNQVLVNKDVSFISLYCILEAIVPLSGEFLALFKPQFEVGRAAKRNKKGVVMDKEAILNALENFKNHLKTKDFQILKIQESLVKGKNGNVEFFIHFKRA